MTKKMTAEEKAMKDAEKEATGAQKKNGGKAEPVTIETSIRDLDVKFPDYIQNVGGTVMDAMCKEVRKMAKYGVNEDKVEGQITLRMYKEGLKLTLTARTQVVVKDVQRDEFPGITADPKQPELPLNGSGKSEGHPKITSGDTVVPPTETTALAAKDRPEADAEQAEA